MVTDFEKLVSLCDEELKLREYGSNLYRHYLANWNELRIWMNANNLTEFSEEIGNRYCDEKLGTHLMPHRPPISLRLKIRSVRMLVSYQKGGDFEFRSPSVDYKFGGKFGMDAGEYILYCEQKLFLSRATVSNKRLYLYSFSRFLESRIKVYDELSVELIEEYFNTSGFSLASRHNAASTIRIFLRFVFDEGKSSMDYSIYVSKDNYKKNCKLPTTYEEDEIQSMIASVERASSIGKRDYLILLLAAEYGWRAKDITEFSFEDIDWDNNVICFSQNKTGYPVRFPLLASVGNAIIDYLKFARPKTDAPQIIVSHEKSLRGKPLTSKTIHSIVTKYLRRAGIKNLDKKRHGPHAMRHSLATNMLKKNVSLSVISTVMGHQNTETTAIYLSVDFERLKKCALPMPALHSKYYSMEGNHGQV